MHQNLRYLRSKCNKVSGYKINTCKLIANNELLEKITHTYAQMHTYTQIRICNSSRKKMVISLNKM